ncbi:MAG: c-type cytochrome [Magnetococcales bacterium]|nr:c-type cytochrome [Magnetococcales bacterium]
MQHSALVSFIAKCSLAVFLFSLPGVGGAADEEAAKNTARQNDCFRCHDIDKGKKAKDGPPWRSIGNRYKNMDPAGSHEKVVEHITSGEKVKFPDGHEENHKRIKSDDRAEIDNLVSWILSLR